MHEEGSTSKLELRAFFTDHHGTIREDPVTGSLNASVAQWLLDTGRARAPYVATQGRCVGHAGRIEIDRDAGGIVWIGGRTQTMFEGSAVF
jgi:predicted PhzF superfamily epimerase YddE/YHI9